MAEVITEYVGAKRESDKFNTRWWTEKPEEQYRHIYETVRMLETRQNYRTLENIKNARLYSDLEVLGLYAGLYIPGLRDSVMPNRLSLNLIKSCCDTVTSKIAKSKPRPMFLTEDGNWPLQKKAQDLTKFIDGQFDCMDHYETKQDTFRDSTVFGTGATKFYIDRLRKSICSERVIVEELIVDDAEAIYGKPRTLYQRRLINKDVLKEYFPKKIDLIEMAGNDIKTNSNSVSMKDLVKVIEAWHLPSSPEANDGRHAIIVDGGTIDSTPWEFDWLPFSFDRWNKNLLGFYGIGLSRELTGLQVEINKILRNIQLSMHLFAIPRVWVENNSQVNISGLTNDLAMIGKYTGSTPQFHTPQAMSPDVYAHLWNLWTKGYEVSGVSQLSANAQKPQGLDSGVALRTYQDIESDRFQIVGQRREMSFLQDAKIVIEMAKILSKEEGDFKVKVSDQGSMKTIRFSEIDLNEEKYLMRVFPTSILPTQPAAKMQTIVEYTQAGFFDKETAMDLMDFPDIKSATSRQIAPRRLIFKILDEMVETGKYQAPEPYYNIDLALGIATSYCMDAKLQGVAEDRLELIRTFMTDLSTLKALATPPAPQMPGPQGGVPPQDPSQAMNPIATPEGQPTSQLLPVAG